MKWFIKSLAYVLMCCVVSITLSTSFAFAEQPQEKANLNAQLASQTAFTYQGQLKDANGLVNGSYDLRFILHSAQMDEKELGSVEQKDLTLTNGLFNVQLDFGQMAADANESWLEIAVRPSGSTEVYTVLSPRQKLSPTPYAILAQHEQWSLIGVPVGVVGRDMDIAASNKPANTDEALVGEPESTSVNRSKETRDGLADQAPAAPATDAEWTSGPGVVYLTTPANNVGIGTSTPIQPLEVVRAQATIRLVTQTQTNGSVVELRNNVSNPTFLGAINFLEPSGNPPFGNAIGQIGYLGAANAMNFRVNNSERMRIAANGNVGIGTTSPTSRLHVASDTNNTGDTGITIDIPGLGTRRILVGSPNSGGPGRRMLLVLN